MAEGNIYVAIDISGYGRFDGTGNIDAAVEFAQAVGVFGGVGSGSIDVAVYVTASGGAGLIGEGSVLVSATLSGTGVSGFVGSGNISASVVISGPGSTGSQGFGNINAVIDIRGQMGVGSLGSGSLAIEVGISGSGFAEMLGSGGIVVSVGIVGTGSVAFSASLSTYTMNVGNKSIARASTAMTSYAIIGGALYATAPTGIVRFAPDSLDSAVPFQVSIEKRGMSMGAANVKSVTEAYLHMQSSDDFDFLAATESAEATFQVVDSVAYMHTCKVEMPRGLRGRTFRWGIVNDNGARMKLAEAEFIVASSTTRRTRQSRGQ